MNAGVKLDMEVLPAIFHALLASGAPAASTTASV